MERKRAMGSASVCKTGTEIERYWCLLLHQETARVLFQRVLFLTTAPLGTTCPCQLVPLTSQTSRNSHSVWERESHLVSVIDKKNPSLSNETGTPTLKNSHFGTYIFSFGNFQVQWVIALFKENLIWKCSHYFYNFKKKNS